MLCIFFNPCFAHYFSFRPHAWCDIIGVYNTSICNVPRCGIILTTISNKCIVFMILFHLSYIFLYICYDIYLFFNDSCPINTSYSIIIIMIGHRNRFIQDMDLSESTSLTHLLNRHTREDDRAGKNHDFFKKVMIFFFFFYLNRLF